jgi:hypothetical protein
MQALEHDTDKREQINRFIVDLQKLKCLVENLLQLACSESGFVFIEQNTKQPY